MLTGNLTLDLISLYDLAATIAMLLRRAFNGAIRTIHAAITLFGTDDIPAIFTLIKILTGIRGHFLQLLIRTNRAGYNAF